MRCRDKENQQHVGEPSPALEEHLQTKAENDRSPPAKAVPAQPPAPRKKQNSNASCCHYRRQPRREIGFIKEMETRDLSPIEKRRLVESRLIIEIGNDIIRALAHLARGLGKAGLIPIDERQGPGPSAMQEKAGKEYEGRITDYAGQSGDSRPSAHEIQIRNLFGINNRRHHLRSGGSQRIASADAAQISCPARSRVAHFQRGCAAVQVTHTSSEASAATHRDTANTRDSSSSHSRSDAEGAGRAPELRHGDEHATPDFSR